jgi:hypothetical protein
VTLDLADPNIRATLRQVETRAGTRVRLTFEFLRLPAYEERVRLALIELLRPASPAADVAVDAP